MISIDSEFMVYCAKAFIVGRLVWYGMGGNGIGMGYMSSRRVGGSAGWICITTIPGVMHSLSNFLMSSNIQKQRGN